jgi:hypothetical protein
VWCKHFNTQLDGNAPDAEPAIVEEELIEEEYRTQDQCGYPRVQRVWMGRCRVPEDVCTRNRVR